MTGDETVTDPGIQHTRAVAIDAPAGQVWQWLAQIGQDRGGFYSYTWLENLAGCRMRNADRIRPEWQQRARGGAVGRSHTLRSRAQRASTTTQSTTPAYRCPSGPVAIHAATTTCGGRGRGIP
jgi:hypothetical protein